MSAKTIKQLNEEARTLLLEAKTIVEKGDEATQEEAASVAVKTAAAEKIVQDLETFNNGDALKTINRIENTIAAHFAPDRPPLGGSGGGPGSDGIGTNRRGEIKSIGDLFISDDRFTAWLKSLAPSGRIPERTAIISPTIEVKTLYTSAADALADRPLLGQPERRPEIVQLGWISLVVRQLITSLTTNTDLVEVVRELSRTNNADIVAEATATGDGSGAKPESALDFELIQTAVKTIAHWVPASTRVLADAARLRGEIDAFLRMGIDQKLEAQILVGDGLGQNFTGVRNTANILTQAFATDILTTTRKARTKLMIEGFVRPTGFVMHPTNWETIDLLQDAEQRYYFGGPMVMGTPRLWGQPVVESQYMTEGFSVLGYWPDAVLYDREQTSITVSNQHADFFVRNLIAILAEMRAAFHVRRPKSFIDVDLVS